MEELPVLECGAMCALTILKENYASDSFCFGLLPSLVFLIIFLLCLAGNPLTGDGECKLMKLIPSEGAPLAPQMCPSNSEVCS